MLSVIPNDPRFSDQWSLHDTGKTGGTFDGCVRGHGLGRVSTSQPLLITSNSIEVARRRFKEAIDGHHLLRRSGVFRTFFGSGENCL